MVTQFVLHTDKKDLAGRCPVHLLVYFDGARLKCATGEKCKPADWNADKQKFRASYPLAEEANDLLKLMAANVLAWWRKRRAAGEAPTLAGLRAVLRPAPAETATPAARASITVLNTEGPRQDSNHADIREGGGRPAAPDHTAHLGRSVGGYG